jgi:hypothetical protein
MSIYTKVEKAMSDAKAHPNCEIVLDKRAGIAVVLDRSWGRNEWCVYNLGSLVELRYHEGDAHNDLLALLSRANRR